MSAVTAPSGLPQHDLTRVLSQVVECAPNGVVLTRSDGSILLVNAELERMFGYTRSQLLERPIERLVPERFREGHAALRSELADDGRPRAMGTGRELIGLRADGSEFPIEVGLSTLDTSEGVLAVESVVDISVRKRLERMFQRMVEAAPCSMVMIDGRGRIVLVNPQVEQMFGYARTELIGSPLEMLLPERFRAAHCLHRRAFANGPTMRRMGAGRDLTARRKDGTEFPVEIGLSPVTSEESGLVLATVSDLTHRKLMERELEQANANLEEFTYAASHELKSPLRGIADLMEWIAEDLGEAQKPEILRNLQRVGTRVTRLERVIDELLKYAKSGKSSVEPEMVDPHALIEDALDMQPQRERFQVSVQNEAAPFVTERTPLETVLRNLISNAFKHHDRESGSLKIRVTHADRFCLFAITDDGPGIPTASQERVFRMFQTLAGTAGTGIGLALSKRLVESHGGRIEIDSADGVRGTTFRVFWPRFQWRSSDE
jgi:PAS domain S-box-containing protein